MKRIALFNCGLPYAYLASTHGGFARLTLALKNPYYSLPVYLCISSYAAFFGQKNGLGDNAETVLLVFLRISPWEKTRNLVFFGFSLARFFIFAI